MIDSSHRDSTGGSVHCGDFLAWKMLYELRRDDVDVEEDVLADLNFDSHALAEVVIDNPEEVVNNQIILDIRDAIFDIFL